MSRRGTERADAFLEGGSRTRRTLISPEGVPLEIQVAGVMERCGAFALDMFIMFVIVFVVSFFLIWLSFAGTGFSVIWTLIAFVGFLVRNCYFLHFELTWQGRTPGKKACNLRVINRNGGELSPSAVIARNLTREVEFFLPFSLLFTLQPDGTAWRHLTILGWVVVIATLPLWNKGRLRAGDLIGGTQVIAMPKRSLRMDLSAEPAAETSEAYNFSHQQLSLYGAFELQVLEEILRRPVGPDTDKLLGDVCRKICEKIGWEGVVQPGEVRRFLTDFYSAERAELERGQLFGRVKEHKADHRPPNAGKALPGLEKKGVKNAGQIIKG